MEDDKVPHFALVIKKGERAKISDDFLFPLDMTHESILYHRGCHPHVFVDFPNFQYLIAIIALLPW